MTERELEEIEARKDPADIERLVIEVRYLNVMLEQAQQSVDATLAVVQRLNQMQRLKWMH
jgi:hypothetical protein